MKKSIDDEINVLSTSIIDIQEMFVEEESNKEFLLNTEDILIKFITYLEFWI